MTDATPSAMIKQYITLRDHKKKAEDEFKKSMERVNLAMDVLEGKLLEQLNTLEVDNLSAKGIGTVYKKLTVSCSVEDPAAFKSWLESREDDRWDALDLKANKTFVTEMMQKEGLTPPGVKVSSIQSIGIQRKSA